LAPLRERSPWSGFECHKLLFFDARHNNVQINKSMHGSSSVSFWYKLGGRVEVWRRRNFYHGFVEGHQYEFESFRMFFGQTSTLIPSMHHKITEYGKFYMKTNQLRTEKLWLN
jgi:hypothetical protein